MKYTVGKDDIYDVFGTDSEKVIELGDVYGDDIPAQMGTNETNKPSHQRSKNKRQNIREH
jgi:hypothetical protein